jgi:hypothetical protein
MTQPRKGREITAAELAAQLANDPQFRRDEATRDAAIDAKQRAWREAERPILDDLRSAGVQVDSVWDLVNSSEPYPAALDVLVEHLESGGYPDRVMEGLGRALAVEPAVKYWDRLKAVYVAIAGPDGRDGVAVALAASATEPQVADLLDLVGASHLGRSRIFLLRPLERLGGRKGSAAIESLVGDPDLGLEAQAIIGERR